MPNLGEPPTGLIPTDNSNLWNVTFELDCSPSAYNYPGSNTPLIGGFRIILETGVAEFGQYSWQDYDSYPLVDPDTGALAALQSGLGTVTDGRNGTVPEPAMLILIGFGLVGLGYSRRRTH